ncbi:FRG domain-containing protein [Flavobacteriaceae bacterium S356]|uniref:FRG domain-containing protein n=1 Tax=Asprobacillus argus TaxID=3076534 RepID=A0ABU3LH49_9FLAO|nr:FRG domain-containing protein [Flavobacteriaceae bacterium S356]
MARTPRWNFDKFKDGVQTVTLSSWKYFHDFLKDQNLLEKRTYIYRGQSDSSWAVQPSIHRGLRKVLSKASYENILEEHLDTFKYSIRGRIKGLKEIINDENELWTLGQHHGLRTPLLDFSASPYVASYFAFQAKENSSKFRTIWMLAAVVIEEEIDDQLEMYHPLSDITPRLISQDGLFVKFNVKKDLKTIIESTEQKTNIFLYEVKIPEKDRSSCLKSLNRMNINHKSLFPDLLGASIYANLHLEIDKY